MNQFVFDLEAKTNFSESDFFVNSTNKKAVDLVSLWPDWHNKAAIIYGEGKQQLFASNDIVAKARMEL